MLTKHWKLPLDTCADLLWLFLSTLLLTKLLTTYISHKFGFRSILLTASTILLSISLFIISQIDLKPQQIQQNQDHILDLIYGLSFALAVFYGVFGNLYYNCQSLINEGKDAPVVYGLSISAENLGLCVFFGVSCGVWGSGGLWVWGCGCLGI